MSLEMDCMVTNGTIHTWWQKKLIIVVKCKRTLKLKIDQGQWETYKTLNKKSKITFQIIRMFI